MPSFTDYHTAIARICDTYDRVRGTGFLVSQEYLLTCAHVVRQASYLQSTEAFPQDSIKIGFPNCSGQPERWANVVIWQPNRKFTEGRVKEDIALLKLDEPLSTDEIHPIDLISVKDPWDHTFRVFGFPSNYDAGLSTTGEIRAPQKTWGLQLQVRLGEVPIQGGFSGAPLWDETENGIVGMTVAADEYDEETRQGGRLAFAIPASILAEVWLKQGRLIELLTLVYEQHSSLIQQAYNACRPPNWFTEPPQSLAQMVIDLYGLDEEQGLTGNGCSPLVEFAVHLLVSPTISYSLRGKLQEWITKAFNLERQKINELCDRVSSSQTNTSPQKTLQSRLFLLIQQEGTSDRYGINAAFIQDIRPYTPQNPIGYEPLELNVPPFSLEQLTTPPPELFGDLLDRLAKKRGTLQIEVFLPFNLLDQAVDSWQCESDYDDPFPIGQDYPLVIRIWDRLGYHKPYRKVIEWRKKWQENRFQQPCQELLVCGDRTREEIYEDLETKKAMGWRKTQPPQVGKGGEFSIVMRKGIPIALWTRENLETCCNAEKYQNLLETPLQDLPQTLKRIRNSTPAKEKTHLGHHLALLWDNPNHIPPDAPLFSNDNC